VGHEIAHVDLRHALHCVAPGDAAVKAHGIDTLRQFLVPLAIGFSDEQEFEANAWVHERIQRRLEHTRHESLAFLGDIEGYAEKNDVPNSRKAPDPRSGLNLAENHFRALPAPWARLKKRDASGSTPAFPPSGPSR
jgi:hypothetical protein